MNLIAKEYIASRPDKTGVLILSEMAGASKELAEAITINPNSTQEIAVALRMALEMPEPEQIRRNEIMQNRLRRYNVVRWAEDFLGQLSSVKAEGNRLRSRLLGPGTKERLLADFGRARRRALFLDYDGTLVPFARDPQAVRPTPELLELLRNLAHDTHNEIVLISGRDKNTLWDWFADLGIALVAEHGVWTRKPEEDWQLLKPLDNSWKPMILPILATYAERLPGAFIEEKEYSVAWHYRAADLELGASRAKELVDDLVNFTANIDVQVLQGSRVVEIKCAGVNKGTAAMPFLSDATDFILAIGDDWTDEDLFKALPETAYSIRVGIRHSHARFNLHNHVEATELLRELAEE